MHVLNLPRKRKNKTARRLNAAEAYPCAPPFAAKHTDIAKAGAANTVKAIPCFNDYSFPLPEKSQYVPYLNAYVLKTPPFSEHIFSSSS